MINQQLLDYVRTQRSSGLSKEAIVSALAAGGWNANDVNEAFMAIEGVRTPPPGPATMAPLAPRTIVPPIGTAPKPETPGAAVIAPTSPQVIVSRPVVAASESTAAPVRKKRSIGSTLALIVLILVVLGVGGIGTLALMNPLLVASYVPQMSMFFPEAPTQ
ncbi:MAG: hypothetical protein G01um101456_419 [Parcubacteria group bacterium Gr01-1014_56]|nr:MAG: hypothetical protein G01um101456_419 [Parcubacteria group bacterium Gr01-1014_56]